MTKRRNFTLDELDLVEAMLAQDVSVPDIAARLGRHRYSLDYLIKVRTLPVARDEATVLPTEPETVGLRLFKTPRSGEASPNAKPRSTDQKCRTCLNCRCEFLSDGPSNRLCVACRRISASPYEL